MNVSYIHLVLASWLFLFHCTELECKSLMFSGYDKDRGEDFAELNRRAIKLIKEEWGSFAEKVDGAPEYITTLKYVFF